MEESGCEENRQKLESHQDSISHSFSYDGYERFHDEAMDTISVSVHYSDVEEAFNGNSRTNLTASEMTEKKMKISLSQEQLRVSSCSKNFLTVPTSARKARSSSFSSVDKRAVKMSPQEPIVEQHECTADVNRVAALTPPLITTNTVDDENEIIYAVPRKATTRENEISTSSASLSPSKSVASAQTSTAELNRNFKYPLWFYCKICNDMLNDPRTLDCLHSFCVQCLVRLDASSNLQNNQFWRKISEHSDSSCELMAIDTMNSMRKRLVYDSFSPAAVDGCVEFGVRENSHEGEAPAARRKYEKNPQGQGECSLQRFNTSPPIVNGDW